MKTFVVALVTWPMLLSPADGARPLSYKYYPDVVVQKGECIDPVHSVSFTGDFYPRGRCERHRCFINAGGQGHVEVTGCPPPQIRGCWPLANETQPYPRCCKHIIMCMPGVIDLGDHGSFSVIQATPNDLQARVFTTARRGMLTCR